MTETANYFSEAELLCWKKSQNIWERIILFPTVCLPDLRATDLLLAIINSPQRTPTSTPCSKSPFINLGAYCSTAALSSAQIKHSGLSGFRKALHKNQRREWIGTKQVLSLGDSNYSSENLAFKRLQQGEKVEKKRRKRQKRRTGRNSPEPVRQVNNKERKGQILG